MKIKDLNIKKWSSRLITISLSIILLVMIVVVISSKASGGEPSLFGYQLKSVLSGSMEPTFKTGSVIAVKPLEDASNLKEGDIITFLQSEKEVVTHRVNGVVDQGDQVMYQTKGDNNEDIDTNLVPSTNVVAKYTGVTIPYLGYFMNFSRSSTGTAVLLIVPGILLLIYSAITIFTALKDIDQPRSKKDVEETA